MTNCKFEVGKTYTDKSGRDVFIYHISHPDSTKWCVLGSVNTGTPSESDNKYTINGAYDVNERPHIYDLIPPVEPLKPVLGAFYLDDKGLVRILVLYNLDYKAMSVFHNSDYSYVRSTTFPRHVDCEFTLIKQLTDEEVRALINKAVTGE